MLFSQERGNVAKKSLRFHAPFYNLLKISASKNQVWPRPAGNFGDAYLARTIDILLIIHYLCKK